ncbi:GNAT family N-acetyltransferase [Arthrobacter sp. H14-L1]|uniref:GNAT family N-acetyltransferase n=1 Tax=Arthrobacter sp. H14-L1 TaxID=2996697 RepID=UPI002271BD44|nr:GNAT family N-acetyltransferase [Arthrobacter sp. H14-L1]MCY0904624.1 GNAT family N-acetyltransferase [Arthrobacter sp. H14-L1]
MSELTYRAWREGDDLALNELWGDPETYQSGQFRAAFAPNSVGRNGGGTDDGGSTVTDGSWRRCIVAEDQGIPVAAGVVYETRLHPERLWAYLEVARDHRRAGVGATLLTMLRREAERAPSGVRALRTKVEPGTPGAAFAQAAGLRQLQRSRIVRVQPGALRLPVFGDGSEAAATARVQDLATGSVELTDVVGRYYADVHQWDATGVLPPGTVQRLFLDDLSGAHGAVVLRQTPESAFGATVAPSKKGSLQAFAVSYSQGATDEPTDVFLGHEPALPAGEAVAAVRDLLALIAHQYPVVLELDDSMAALSAVVEPMLASSAAQVLGAETLVVGD